MSDQENRRSHRLTIQMSVRVSYFADNPSRLASDASTLDINANGALLRLPWGVPLGQEMLIQLHSSEATERVTVACVEYAGSGDYYVGVEFREPNRAFWGVSFPPDDWSPSHPDAKPSALVDS